MTIDEFRGEIKVAAENEFATMANEAQADSNEPFLKEVVFDDEDEQELTRRIESREIVTGFISWVGGWRSCFEAWNSDGAVMTRFAPWEKLPAS